MYQLIIPTFNNPTFLKNFLNQTIHYKFKKIEIFDNNSNYPPMIEEINNIEKTENIVIHRLNSNFGPHYAIRNPEIFDSLDDIFCLSDPDIKFSESLPDNFLEIMFEISNKYQIGKIGFAIKVPSKEELTNPFVFMDGRLQNILDWEKQFWQTLIGHTKYGDPIYEATLDTTFALYNKKFFDPNDRYKALRVAGNFTSKHLGFYPEKFVSKQELDFYRGESRFSYFSGKYDRDGNPEVSLSVLEYTKLMEKMESLERNVISIATERDEINRALQNLYRSTSWKITKPLRNLNNLISNGKIS